MPSIVQHPGIWLLIIPSLLVESAALTETLKRRAVLASISFSLEDEYTRLCKVMYLCKVFDC